MPSSRCVLPVPTGPCRTSGLTAWPGSSTTLRAEAWATRLRPDDELAQPPPAAPVQRWIAGRRGRIEQASGRLQRVLGRGRATGWSGTGALGNRSLRLPRGLKQARVDDKANTNRGAQHLRRDTAHRLGEFTFEKFLTI